MLQYVMYIIFPDENIRELVYSQKKDVNNSHNTLIELVANTFFSS